MSGQIIPFGKYKGQPVENLQNDPDYTNWLISQPGIKDKFPGIYNIIINNFGEASDTPEHNFLQSLLLDDIFRANLIERLFPNYILNFLDGCSNYYGKTLVDFEVSAACGNIDAVIGVFCGCRGLNFEIPTTEVQIKSYIDEDNYENTDCVFWLKNGHDKYNYYIRTDAHIPNGFVYSNPENMTVKDISVKVLKKAAQESGAPLAPSWMYNNPNFTYGKREVKLIEVDKIEYRNDKIISFSIPVEIKPYIADDYPSIIRQVQRYKLSLSSAKVPWRNIVTDNKWISDGSNPLFCILTKDYIGRGATKEQFMRIMKSQGIKVIYLSEV